MKSSPKEKKLIEKFIEVQELQNDLEELKPRNHYKLDPVAIYLEYEDGFNMHFASLLETRKNKKIFSWHFMPFQKDFMELIAKHG